jgi:hypothetical protein
MYKYNIEKNPSGYSMGLCGFKSVFETHWVENLNEIKREGQSPVINQTAGRICSKNITRKFRPTQKDTPVST